MRRWAMALGLMLAAWLGISLAVAHHLTQRRHPRTAEPEPKLDWGRVESRRHVTRDGQDIGSWFVEGSRDGPTVLLLHGHGGRRADCLGRARLLAEAGCSVMLLSLRAHGDSSGEFDDVGYSARHDVVAAVEYLERRRPGRPLVVHGTSMGAAAAVFAAGELGRRVHGYILESPYRDLRTAVRNRVENALPPLLDWLAYRGLMTVSPLVLPDLDRIAPVEAVAGVPPEVPVLILAGGHDELARPFEARALQRRLEGHSRLLVFETAGHLGFLQSEPDRYRQSVVEFVQGATRRGEGRWRARAAVNGSWRTGP